MPFRAERGSPLRLFFVDWPKNVKSFPLNGVRGRLCGAAPRRRHGGDPLGKRLNIFWPASRFAAGWPRLVRGTVNRGGAAFKNFLIFGPPLVRGAPRLKTF